MPYLNRRLKIKPKKIYGFRKRGRGVIIPASFLGTPTTY